ncbi:hypothetical protein SEA_CHASER_75 [Mycobacterium phage Chaser]|nr:hypothetical protein SEA_CHASER_75 [Mycobacterium phage Chaser]
MAGIVITAGGVRLPIAGTNAVVVYDATTRVLEITGLSGLDRIMLSADSRDDSQAVKINFR